MEVLQREGFTVKKDKRGRREYTENDIMVIEKLIELSKHDGMTLERAAKMIVQRLEIANINADPEESQETDLIPFHIQQQLQQQYSVMAKEMKQSMLEMEKRLSERAEKRSERIEIMLERRDNYLMKTIREMQETKRLMQEYRDEVAAEKEKKKPWWRFW
jgi:DNA-binding transcriptional MerR regulator